MKKISMYDERVQYDVDKQKRRKKLKQKTRGKKEKLNLTNALSKPEKSTLLLQVDEMLNQSSLHFHKFWRNFHTLPHSEFLAALTDYLSIEIVGQHSGEMWKATPDSNLIHTPFAKEIDINNIALLKSLDGANKRRNIFDKIVDYSHISLNNYNIEVKEKVFINLVSSIWDNISLSYTYDERKKNAQCFFWVTSQILSALAMLAGIDSTYQASSKNKMKEEWLNWLSPKAVSMGLNGYRQAIKDNGLHAQLKLMIPKTKAISIPELIKESGLGSELVSSMARSIIKKLSRGRSTVTEELIVEVNELFDGARNVEIVKAHSCDSNGFGSKFGDMLEDHLLNLAKSAIEHFYILLKESDSINMFNQIGNVMCGLRIINTIGKVTKTIRIFYYAVYEKNELGNTEGWKKKSISLETREFSSYNVF